MNDNLPVNPSQNPGRYEQRGHQQPGGDYPDNSIRNHRLEAGDQGADQSPGKSFRSRIEGLLPDRLKSQYQLQRQNYQGTIFEAPMDEINEESNGRSQSLQGTGDLDYLLRANNQ